MGLSTSSFIQMVFICNRPFLCHLPCEIYIAGASMVTSGQFGQMQKNSLRFSSHAMNWAGSSLLKKFVMSRGAT